MTEFRSSLQPYFIISSLFYYRQYLLVSYERRGLCFPKSRYSCPPPLRYILLLFYRRFYGTLCTSVINIYPSSRLSLSTGCPPLGPPITKKKDVSSVLTHPPSHALRRIAILSLLNPRPSGARTHGRRALKTALSPQKENAPFEGVFSAYKTETNT